MKKRYLLPIGIFLILLSLIFQHSTKPAAQTSLIEHPESLLPSLSEEDQVFVEDYRAFLIEQLKTEGVPGAAFAIIMDSTLALVEGYGLRDAESSMPVDEQTVFRLASLSKGITGLLAGKMVQEGDISWDAAIRPYCYKLELYSEDFANRLKLEHLLSHSTGLPRHTYSNLLNMGVPYMEIRPQLASVAPTHDPGTYHNYQNVVFSLSGEVLAGTGGATFAELLQQKIFDPLQMWDASTGLAGMQGTNIALPHRRAGSGYTPIAIEPNYYEVLPAAGINASITDMSKLLQALMGNEQALFPDSMLQEVFQPYVPIHLAERCVRRWDFLESAHYGMGWRVFDAPEMQIIQHSGYVNGYRSEVAFSPDEKIGIVLLTNAPNYTVGYSIPAFFEQYLEKRSNP